MRENSDQWPNSHLAQYIMYANTEASSGTHNSPWQYSAQHKNQLAYRGINQTFTEYDGLYAGKGGRGNSELGGSNARSCARHGKIILTLMPQLFDKDYFRYMGVTNPWGTESGMQNEYTKD